MRLPAIALLTLTLAGCTSPLTVEPRSVEPEPRTDPVNLTGEGETTTAPFELQGDYRVEWTTAGDCYYNVDLEGGLGTSLFSADTPTSGETFVYDTEGTYYLDVITGPAPGCGWSVSFDPQ